MPNLTHRREFLKALRHFKCIGLCFQSPHNQVMLPQNQDPAMHLRNVFSKFLKFFKMTHNRPTKRQSEMLMIHSRIKKNQSISTPVVLISTKKSKASWFANCCKASTQLQLELSWFQCPLLQQQNNSSFKRKVVFIYALVLDNNFQLEHCTFQPVSVTIKLQLVPG